MYSTLIIILIFIFGAILGSAINCFIEREISGFAWWHGRSRCPHCHRELAWFELLPIVSFIALRGRCLTCGKRLRWQYLLSEISLGVFFVIAWQHSGISFSLVSFNNFWPLLIIIRDWLMLCFLFAIFWYDFRCQLIPDTWVILGAALAFSFGIFLGDPWWRLLLGAAAIGGFLALQYLISRGRWLGLGDVKLGIFLGFLTPWPTALITVFLAYLFGALVSLYLLSRRQVVLKTAVPFGPFLTFSAALVLFYGQPIINWYFSHLGF